MSDLEFRILRFIHRHPDPVLWTSVINTFSPFSDPAETDSVLRSLLAAGTIRKASPGGDPQLSRIALSDSGVSSLILADEHHSKLISDQEGHQNEILHNAAREESRRKAERDIEHKFQSKLSLRNLVLTALLSAFLTNIDRILPKVIALFHP